MREILARSLDATNVPHLLARPSQEEPSGVVVWSEVQPIREALNNKAEVAELEAAINQLEAMLAQLQVAIASKIGNAELNNAFISTIKEFTLTGGVAVQRVSGEDNQEYTYTTFEFVTGFGSLSFKSFDLSETLDPYTRAGYSYVFQKFGVDSARIVFESAVGKFPDDRVAISLIKIPRAEIVPPIEGGNQLQPQGILIDSSGFIPYAYAEAEPAANVFDGNPGTRWIAWQAQKEGDWFRLDMGMTRQISRVEIDCEGDWFVRSLTISGSNNNMDWREIKTVEGSTQTVITFNPIDYRFLELSCAENADQFWGIKEIRVFS